MNYCTKIQRVRKGISLDLPQNYNRVWVARLPSIISMMECGLKYREIAKHYDCKITAFGVAMQYHNVRANDIRHKQRNKREAKA
jgi:hypothetical protein